MCGEKLGTPAKGLFPDLGQYETFLRSSIPEVSGYKTSLFKIVTSEWVVITAVQGKLKFSRLIFKLRT